MKTTTMSDEATAGTDHAEMAGILMSRTAEVVRLLADMWHANSPEDSVSGSDYGLARRAGRRDACVTGIAALMRLPSHRVEAMLEANTL